MANRQIRSDCRKLGVSNHKFRQLLTAIFYVVMHESSMIVIGCRVWQTAFGNSEQRLLRQYI